MPDLVKQEEQDTELNCSKSDRSLEGDNESVLIHTPKTNDNIILIRKEKYDQCRSTDRVKYIELETFDAFYDDYVESKTYIDGILKSLNFGKEFDSQALSETNIDANSIKHLEDKINVLQNDNKQLKDENRILSEVIKLIHENKMYNRK